MILGFVLVIIVIGSGIALSIFSMYLPFVQDLSDVKFYNAAYYGALSSIERGSLALRYHQPGYEGESPVSDYISGNFGLFTKQESTMKWKITSRTTSIPAPGQGNVDPLFAMHSSNHNRLGYYQKEDFFLWYDATQQTGSSKVFGIPTAIQKITGTAIFLNIRLNPVIYSGFGGSTNGLLANDPNISGHDQDNDNVADDVVVDRSWRGKYGLFPYTILPKERVLYYGTRAIPAATDTLIRESVVNAVGDGLVSNVIFTNDGQPIKEPPGRQNTTGLNVISESSILSGVTFEWLLTNPMVTDSQLSISLINKLISQGGGIYPFLEYRLTAGGAVMPDRFYTIEAEGKVGGYSVRMLLRKPTSTESIAGDFTIIF